MPQNVPYPIPTNVRDLLIVRLSEPGIDKLTSDQRAHVRNLVAEVYAGGYTDGRIAEHTFALLDQQLAAVPEDPEQTHRWQTIRIVGPLGLSEHMRDPDDDVQVASTGTIRLRCTCGTWCTLAVELNGLTLPPCPESPEARS